MHFLEVVRSLWAELWRRKVARVAAAYLGAAFVVLEGAQLTFGPLGVPDWGYSALVVVAIVGLPIALVLSWLYDLTPEGVVRAGGPSAYARGPISAAGAVAPGSAAAARADHGSPDHTAADHQPPDRTTAVPTPAGPPRGRLRLQIGSLAAVGMVLLTTGAGALAWRFFQAPPPSDELLAVLPFEIRGGPELDYLREGMVDLLSRNIDGVAGLRTLAPATILSRLAEGDEGPVSPERASAVALSLGAGLYVSGSVFASHTTVRIDASVYGAEGSRAAEPVSTARVEGAPDDLLQLVDGLSAQLLAGLRPGQHAARLARTAATTTPSLAALQHYMTGERWLRTAEYDSAIAAFERAVDADSAFALAHYRLSVAAVAERRYDLARRSGRRAEAFGDRLAQRDRALVGAFVLALDGRLEEAERRYRALLRDYPDDMEATYQLAEVLFTANPMRGEPLASAESLYLEVLESDPEFLCPI
jgi:tetratricopeptide (TPR) repeat protein